MQDKIELYKDILQNDPFSRLFYPLSIALKAENKLEEAAHYLEEGLVYHTNFLEARMLFVEVLHYLGDIHKRDVEIEKIMEIFKSYPSFWKICAEKSQDQHNDISLALHFISQALVDKDMTFSKVFSSGLQSLSSPSIHGTSISSASLSHFSGEDETEKKDVENNSEISHDEEFIEPVTHADTDIHTRSMADLLAEQGELEKALVIYKELLEQEEDVDVQAELKFIIQEFETRLKEEPIHTQSQDDSSHLNKESLINTLATLVSRLDARAEAIQTQI